MEDKSRKHLSLLEGFTLYKPDRSEQSLDAVQHEDTLLFSETKQDTTPLVRAWLASSIALEVSSNVFSTLALGVTHKSSTQTKQSALPSEIRGSSQDKIIKTFIAYAKNEKQSARRRINEYYREQIKNKLESISKQICKLECTWQEVDAENQWNKRDDLERSRLILLLLDDNFVNTEYCFCPRLEAVVKNHARTVYVIPIYLRPCITESFLFDTLPFYPSKLEGAVSQQKNKDTAFQTIGDGIVQAVRNIKNNILPALGQ